MKRKLSNKTPEYMPPPTELNLNRGVINMRGFDVDAWTTEQTLLTSLKSYISLAIIGAQTAYRVNKTNCRIGPYVFQEALVTMSDRAEISHKWFSNYVVHDIILYAASEPKLAAAPEETVPTLPQLIAEHFKAEHVIAAKPSMYIGKTEAMVVTANAGNADHPSQLRITFSNQMFASMRFIEPDMMPIVTPKSGAIILNGAVVEAFVGFEAFGKVPAPCSEFDGAYVMPEVSYFDQPAIVSVKFHRDMLSVVKITAECTASELNAWRLQHFGETDEKESGTYRYRIDTGHGLTARVKFFENSPEIIYEFEKTERT